MVCVQDTATGKAKAGPATRAVAGRASDRSSSCGGNRSSYTAPWAEVDVSFWAECGELSGANFPAWWWNEDYSQLKWPGKGLCSRYVQGFKVAGRGVSHEWREAVSSCGMVCCFSRLYSNWCWASGSHITTLFQHTRIMKKKVVWSSHSVKVPAELNTLAARLNVALILTLIHVRGGPTPFVTTMTSICNRSIKAL